jgi:hypothetical protein
MEFVETGDAAVVGELDLELHLVPGDGYPADRTVGADAGPAPRPVWRAGGKLAPSRTAARALSRRIGLREIDVVGLDDRLAAFRTSQDWRADGSSHLATSMPQHGGSGRCEAPDATGRDAGVRQPGRPLEGRAQRLTRPPIQTANSRSATGRRTVKVDLLGGASPCMSHALHGNTRTPRILP